MKSFSDVVTVLLNWDIVSLPYMVITRARGWFFPYIEPVMDTVRGNCICAFA
jgi:hypothetical protein